VAIVVVLVGLLGVIGLELWLLVPIKRAAFRASRLGQLGPHTRALRTLCLEVETGDPVGTCELRGRRAGVDVVVHQRALRAPPWGGAKEKVTSVELPTELAAQLVCRGADLDKLGSSWARGAPTGDAAFDEDHALLTPRAAEHAEAEGSPYREDPPPAPPWVTRESLESLLALDLRWLTVDAGKLELAVAPRMPADLAPLLAVALTTVGRDAAAAPEPLPVRPDPGFATDMAADVFAMCLMLFPAGFVLDLVRPFGAITQRVDCGPTGAMTMTPHHSNTGRGGTWWRVACDNDPDHWLPLHDVVTFLLYVVFILGTMLALHHYRRYLRRLEKPG
jgi:hypothetical protein